VGPRFVFFQQSTFESTEIWRRRAAALVTSKASRSGNLLFQKAGLSAPPLDANPNISTFPGADPGLESLRF